MWQNVHEAYVESRVLSADGIDLVCQLYQGCMTAVRDAREHLASGEIALRARSITKAWGILGELVHSLDRERGGDLAIRLGSLYDYMQRRLLEANLQQTDGPLAEVLGLLATLSEGWDGIHTQKEEPVPASQPWGQMMAQDTGSIASEHVWSF